MPPSVSVIGVRGAFAPEDTPALSAQLDAAFAAGADWVGVDLSAAGPVDGEALAGAARRTGVVVCEGEDALLRALDAAGVIATRRLLDVRVAARAREGDGLKRRFELRALPGV